MGVCWAHGRGGEGKRGKGGVTSQNNPGELCVLFLVSVLCVRQSDDTSIMVYCVVFFQKV